MLKRKSRFIISLVTSVLIVIFSLSFVPRDVVVLASRTPARQAFDYILNFVTFFVAVYLLLSLFAFIEKKLRKK